MGLLDNLMGRTFEFEVSEDGGGEERLRINVGTEDGRDTIRRITFDLEVMASFDSGELSEHEVMRTALLLVRDSLDAWLDAEGLGREYEEEDDEEEDDEENSEEE